MPTPGKRDPAGRRAAILDAAAELICEAGASCLTHRAVAARAHVAVGSTTQYFASIDDLRDEALQALADENDEALAEVAGILETLDGSGAVEETIARCAGILHDFLADPRRVHASLAMTSTAMTDPSLRTLALQWSDQLTDLLAGRFGRPRAAAAVAYVDGLTVHAALHDGATDTSSITAVLTALLAMPDTQEPTP
ncbi:TetR/AcrR family transcriptional regulator [Corynebacterium sp.]|uniref:TetR/AcrR family transcriptional regulator n=1 Tax=Corynebacterium sp. TaxID=1720 RepID=UPI0026482058|nr:TetR family transcriptional regulator [Corynebacterium sp.]MDN5720073.1 TetR family transcriptional regulator [Corynebacterium sp.]